MLEVAAGYGGQLAHGGKRCDAPVVGVHHLTAGGNTSVAEPRLPLSQLACVGADGARGAPRTQAAHNALALLRGAAQGRGDGAALGAGGAHDGGGASEVESRDDLHEL